MSSLHLFFSVPLVWVSQTWMDEVVSSCSVVKKLFLGIRLKSNHTARVLLLARLWVVDFALKVPSGAMQLKLGTEHW